VKGGVPSPLGITLNFPPDAQDACPIFAGRFIRNVRNGPSPGWLQKQLRAVGLRPISALVDVTNFIANDRGRPLHVFDAHKLAGGMQARLARDGEICTGAGRKDLRARSGDDCHRRRQTRAQHCCVMGGGDTGCTETTRNVFIESACSIRNGLRRRAASSASSQTRVTVSSAAPIGIRRARS